VEAAKREQIAVRIQPYPVGFFVAETSAGIVGIITTGLTTSDDIADEALRS
jgi:hypothetical protein